MSTKKQRIMQRFNVSWLEEAGFKTWLARSTKGDSFAYCKQCSTDLSIAAGGKNDIYKHSKTAKHQSTSPSTSQQSMSSFVFKKEDTDRVKEGEILLSTFVAEHNLSMNVMEHLPKLIKRVCPDSDIAKKLTCGRTKTTAIIKSVTGAYAKEQIIQHLKLNKFSLLLDESTDRGCIKHLCMIARYFKDGKVTDAFLGLIPLHDATAQKLYDHITTFFNENKIPYKDNMIGYAADGANTMMGNVNSLLTRFKSDIPHLYVMKCICHSFHLCASYACLKLPREPEDLLRDVYNYVSNSPKRILTLKEFQEYVDLKPHKILHQSQTRWLSLRAAVSRILEQYEALILFFTEAAFSDRLKSADTILHMLKNPYNKLYLEFLEFSLEIFTNVNKSMQSEHPQIHKLHETVCRTYHTILDCYMDNSFLSRTELKNVNYENPRNFKPIEDIYLGTKVAMKLLSNSELTDDNIKTFKLKCLDFYIEAARQIKMRYDFGNDIQKDLEILNPEVVASRRFESIMHLALQFPNLVQQENMQTLDTEWRNLRNDPILNQIKNEDVENFWQKITMIINPADGSFLYPQLSKFMTSLLSLPHSSAAVERIFSSINIIKTKQRNQLSTDTIEGLLYTKYWIGSTPCFELELNSSILKNMNTKAMYDFK